MRKETLPVCFRWCRSKKDLPLISWVKSEGRNPEKQSFCPTLMLIWLSWGRAEMVVWHLWTKCPPAHPHTCIKLHATFTNRGMELNGSQLGTENCLGVSIKRAGRLFLQILGQLMPRLSPRDSETWLLVMPCATCCAWLYPRCCGMAIWQKVSPKGIMWTGLWRMCRCSSYGKEDGSCS